MDAYLRKLRRDCVDHPRSTELARYVATLERVLGLSSDPISFEEAQQMLQTAKKLKKRAATQLATAAYREVPTPIGVPITIRWNLPGVVTMNWFDDYPPHSEQMKIAMGEVWEVIIHPTRSPLHFDLTGVEDINSEQVNFVPRWAFMISEDELPIFSQLTPYLPDRYIPGQRSLDVDAIFDD